MARTFAVLTAVAMAMPAAGTFLKATTCPSTSFQFTMEADAAGTPVWVPPEPMNLPDGQCIDTCPPSKEGKIKQFRICGPGTFTFSRMTCANHGYKAGKIKQFRICGPGTFTFSR